MCSNQEDKKNFKIRITIAGYSKTFGNTKSRFD